MDGVMLDRARGEGIGWERKGSEGMGKGGLRLAGTGLDSIRCGVPWDGIGRKGWDGMGYE